MNQHTTPNQTHKRTLLIRLAAGLSALVFAATLVTGLQLHSKASAALLTVRKVTLSDSSPTATGVTYTVAMTTAGAMQSLIIDFCADSPLIGHATCTNPTGMSVAAPTVNFTTGTIGTVSTTGSSAYQLKVSGTASQAAGNVVFTVSGVTNPTAVGTFYARIYTYSNNAFGTPVAYSSPSSIGSAVDMGGIALSTDNAINFSFNLAEALTFCVSGTSVGSCASATSPDMTLGTGSPVILGPTLSTGVAYTLSSTNAVDGMGIAMRNSNACGGLSRDGGATCGIPPAGAAAIVINNGDGKFGLTIGGGTGYTGAPVFAITPYDVPGSYAMDTTTAGNNVTYTFGQYVAKSNFPTQNCQNQFTFAANASTNTPAGVYSAKMLLVAVGKF